MNFGLFPMLTRFKEFKHDWERPYLEGIGRPDLPQHLQGHRAHPDVVRGQSAPASSSSATTSATSTPGASSSTRAWSSRRSSCRPSSASSAASARIPDDLAAHEAHRRPAVRRRATLVGARRRPPPDADRRHGGRDGRQRAGRAGGQPVAGPGQLAASNAEQVARCGRSSRAWGWRSRRPTRRGGCWR